jgi:polyisoprenoid-binding protein YceI
MAKTTWQLDPMHSAAYFQIRHMASKVRGTLKVKQGTLVVDESNHKTAEVDVTLDAASINTGIEPRDNHLRSADGHFDVQNFPTITFKSKRIEGDDRSAFKVIGDLTVRGVTKEISLDAEFGGEQKDMQGIRRASFSATTKVNRKDFGLTWNAPIEAGGWLLGDDVKVEIEAEFVPAKTPGEAQEKAAQTAKAEVTA